MNSIEFGKCEICGKEADLERTYFEYPIHCECCGSVDEDGQKQHFEMVRHCKDCTPKVPKEIHPKLKDLFGCTLNADIKNIIPCDIKGTFMMDNTVAKED